MIDLFFQNLWRWKVGLPEKDYFKKMPDLEQLKITENRDQFNKFCSNRLIMGSFRYGAIKKQDYSRYDLSKEISIRVSRYDKTKNLEHLIDASNMCFLKYLDGKRKKHKFIATDDGEHTEEKFK